MITFNSENILVGYIKQILSDFNLPLPRIYKKSEPLIEKCLYIKDNHIIQIIDGKEVIICAYVPNKKVLNYTTNLDSNGMDYDYHTHEYLGNYLRYIRDVENVNLMSLYNCYSNNFVNNLRLKLEIKDGKNTILNSFQFNSTDNMFKIIMIPVKLFQKYTVAINSYNGLEIFYGFYDKNYYSVADMDLKTVKKIPYTSFDNPILFEELLLENIYENYNLNELSELALNEKNLKLFIKLPSSNTSSIVVLEGDYRGDIDFIQKENNPTKIISNYTVVNYYKSVPTSNIKNTTNILSVDEVGKEKTLILNDYETKDIPVGEELDNIKLNNFNQLLFINSGTSYPFADRLVEYLANNAICPNEKISDNIKRLQLGLYNRYNDNKISLSGKSLDSNASPIANINYLTSKEVGLKSIPRYRGKWESKYRTLIYKIAHEQGLLATNFDILGYLDKDMENVINTDYDIYKEDF